VGQHISTKQFRESYRPGDSVPKDLVVCRAEPFSLHKEESDDPDDKLTKTFTISTSSVDREGDRLLPNWELENFNKGGSVLWGHDSRSTPMHVIGAPKATWQAGEALKSRAQFTPMEVNPVGFMVSQLIDFGALRSTSVGFLPKEWKIIDDDGRWGYDFEKLELLEWSVVPVPANPEALLDAKAFGIDIDPMLAWAEEVLDKGVELVGVERDLIEGAWKMVKAPSVPVPSDVEPPTEEPADKTMDAVEALTDLVGELGKSVAELAEKVTTLAEVKAATPTPTPEKQPAAEPDEVEFDLSDPKFLKSICEVAREEASDGFDTALRTLRGQLPD
jgi:hypothetical protein